MKSNRVLIAGMVCATVLIWGFFIWPTPYRLEKVEQRGYEGQAIQKIYRVNRLTGESTLVVDPRNSSGS